MSRRAAFDGRPLTPLDHRPVAMPGRRSSVPERRLPESDARPPVEIRRVQTAAGPGAIERLARHLVVVPLAGTTIHEVDFEPRRLRPGLVLHVRPGQVHRQAAPRSAETRELRILPGLVPDGLFQPGWFEPLPSGAAAVTEAVSADLEAHLEARVEARRGRGGDPTGVLAAGGSYLLARLARTATLPPGGGTVQGELVAGLLVATERWFTETRSVADYAKALGTSPRTLSRATAALLTRSPKELIDRRVVLEARRLLATTALPVAEVADTLGFSEATNFTKFFVRHTGVGPQEFRVAT